MLLSNNLFCVFMTSLLDTVVSPSSTISYVQVSLWMYIINDLSTQKPIHMRERSPFSWYPIFFEPPCFLSIILWWLQICLMSACLILLVSLHTHEFVEDLLLHAYHGEYVVFYRLNALTSFWHFQLVLVSNWCP